MEFWNSWNFIEILVVSYEVNGMFCMIVFHFTSATAFFENSWNSTKIVCIDVIRKHMKIVFILACNLFSNDQLIIRYQFQNIQQLSFFFQLGFFFLTEQLLILGGTGFSYIIIVVYRYYISKWNISFHSLY